MEVRRLGPGDEDLWGSTVVLLGDHPAADPAAFLRVPSAVAVVATEGGEPVGWAWGHLLARPDGGWMLLLYELDVAPESRRRGVGTALVEEMKGIAARQGCAEMWLVTEDDNDAALATYGATGGKWSDGADRVVAWELSPQD